MSVTNILLILVLIDKIRSNPNKTQPASLSVTDVLKKLEAACGYDKSGTMNKIEVSGKYKVLGKGGFGTVFEMNPKMAFKIVTLKKTIDMTTPKYAQKINELMIEIDFMRFVTKEGRIYTKLDLDTDFESAEIYILKLYGCHFTKVGSGESVSLVKIGLRLEKLDISMEKYLIENSNLPVPHLVDLTKTIIRGLYQMHQYGFVHLDIKPDNVMLRNPFEPVLIDFGLVLRYENTETPMAIENIKMKKFNRRGIQGTPLYIDPMMFDSHFNFYNDVYSLGVMLTDYFKRVKKFQDLVDKKTHKTVLRFEDVIKPGFCTANASCFFKAEDSLRASYFQALIYWMTRQHYANRVYFDLAMEMLKEIEEKYYLDCNSGVIKDKNFICFRTKADYNQYKDEETKKYFSLRSAAQRLLL